MLLARDRQILLNCSRQSGKARSSAPWPCTPPCSRRAASCCCCRRRSGRRPRFPQDPGRLRRPGRPCRRPTRHSSGWSWPTAPASSACPAARRPSAPSAASPARARRGGPRPRRPVPLVRPMLAVSQAGWSPCPRRSASAAGSTTNGTATAPGSASQSPGASARASRRRSSPRRRGRWATPGSARSTNVRSRRSKAWSTRTSSSA